MHSTQSSVTYPRKHYFSNSISFFASSSRNAGTGGHHIDPEESFSALEQTEAKMPEIQSSLQMRMQMKQGSVDINKFTNGPRGTASNPDIKSYVACLKKNRRILSADLSSPLNLSLASSPRYRRDVYFRQSQCFQQSQVYPTDQIRESDGQASQDSELSGSNPQPPLHRSSRATPNEGKKRKQRVLPLSFPTTVDQSTIPVEQDVEQEVSFSVDSDPSSDVGSIIKLQSIIDESIEDENSEDFEDPEVAEERDEDEPKPVCPPSLSSHQEAYRRSCKRLESIDARHELQDALTYLTDHGITAVKYNYALEDMVQDFQSYKCKLSLSKDGLHFNVDIFKPVVDVHHDRHGSSDSSKDDDGRKNRTAKGETQPVEESINYKIKRSSASCRVDEITQITLGGSPSRFWMFRKHINCLSAKEIHQVPFYAWECLTLHLKNRSLNLVIRSEKEMRILLRFLVHSLKTIDGSKNTALPIIDAITSSEAKETNSKLISREYVVSQLREEVELAVLEQTLRGYKLLVIRNKISFQAYLKRQTVYELFFRTILDTVYYLAERGEIAVNLDQDKAFDNIFNPQTRQGKMELRFMTLPQVIQALKIENSGVSMVLAKYNKRMGSSSPKNYKKKNTAEKKEMEKKYMSVNQVTQGFIRKYFQKDEVIEILRDVPQANRNADQFEHWSFQRFFDYKINTKSANVLLKRIRLFTALGLMKGFLYLKIMIRRIELLKEKLILEVEQGKEVYIVRDLSLDSLPASFRYYDFLLRFISENVAEERKEFYGLKKGLNKQLHNRYSTHYFSNKLGLAIQDEKLVFRVKFKDTSKLYEIDYLRSEHTRDVQWSRYVSIDNDMAVKPSFDIEEPVRTLSEYRSQRQDQCNVKYSLQSHVSRNRQEYLKFKSTYASKQAHLKNQGQKLQVLGKLESWLEKEILPVLVARAKPPLNMFQQEKLRKVVLRTAEEILSKRRQRHRVHVFESLKELFLAQIDSELKSLKIDKRITYDYKYFDSVSIRQEIEVNQIKRDHKRVEKQIERRKSKMNFLIEPLSQRSSPLQRKGTVSATIKAFKSKMFTPIP